MSHGVIFLFYSYFCLVLFGMRSLRYNTAKELRAVQEEVLQQDIGCRIMRLRESYGYTREILAEKLGISWQHLANIEKGRRGIPLPLLLQLREQFNVSADYLIYGTANENDITDLIAMLEGVDEAVYPYVKESVISLLKLWNYKKDNPGESCG